MGDECVLCEGTGAYTNGLGARDSICYFCSGTGKIAKNPARSFASNFYVEFNTPTPNITAQTENEWDEWIAEIVTAIKQENPSSSLRRKIAAAMLDGVDDVIVMSREEYNAGRAVMDALPAGVWLHCSKCKGWYHNRAIHFVGANLNAVCKGCKS